MMLPWALARPGLEVRPQLPWLVVGVFVLVLLLVVEAYFRTRPPVPGRRRLLLAALRCAALVVLTLIILDPTVTLTSRVEEKPRIIVLVDTSRSMGFSDAGWPHSEDSPLRPRIERALELLWGPGNGLLQSLRELGDVHLLQFAEDVTPLEEGDTEDRGLGGGGDQTNLGNAITQAVEWGGGARPGALVLLSDGLSNVGRDPILLTSHLGVPVQAIGIGDPDPPRDVSLTRCVANEVAYVESRVEVRVDLAATGLEVGSVPVMLWEDDDLLDSTRVSVGREGETERVSLFFTPTREGTHRYRVEIPSQEGERVVENNQRLLVVSVLKSRMRVYYVEAYPRWDFAFLQRSLERDANVDVTTRVIGRASEPILPPPGEMTAADVFILGNLPGRFLREGEAERLVRAVTEEGKGLVILGGRNGLDYRGTALEEILPVEPGEGEGRHVAGAFQPVVTPEGALHMVTRLESDSERNRRLWADLPPLVALNATGVPKPGAQTLLTHPSLRVGGERLPVVTVQRVGAGKCALVSAYSLWRWDFLVAGFGGESDPFGRFWGNVVRWLVTREDLKRVRVATDRHVYRSGEPILFRAQAYDDLFRPVDGATVVATVRGRERSGGVGVREEVILNPVGVGEGHYEGRLRFLAPGTYEVLLEAWREGNRLGEDRTELAVDTYSLEYERTAMDENLLRRISRVSGGRYYAPGEVGDLAASMNLEGRWVQRVREISVSNHALLFVLFSGLLFAEWLIRKRSGLS